MKKKITRLIEKWISKLYKASKTLLRSQSSYKTEEIDQRNIDLYLMFLEYSFEKPYNRLCSLAHFVNNTGQIMIDQMYPFGFLSEDVKESILDKSEQATKLGRGLDASEIDPNFVVLWKEERIEKSN